MTMEQPDKKVRNTLLFTAIAFGFSALGGLFSFNTNLANAVIILATVFYGLTAGFVTATAISLFFQLVALVYTPMDAKTFFALFLLSIAHKGILILIIAVFRGSGFANFERLAIALTVVFVLSPIISCVLTYLAMYIVVDTPYLQTKAPTMLSILRLYPPAYINSVAASGGYLFLKKHIYKKG